MGIKSKLLKYLKANPQQTYKTRELARQLKVSSADYQHFKKLIKGLVSEGKVYKYKKGRIGVGRKSVTVVGRIDIKSKGFGFLLMEDDTEDVYINEINIGTAFDGDLVRAELFMGARGGKREGRVVEVIERARSSVVGIYFKGKSRGTIVPDDLEIHRDIIVPHEKSNNAKAGQKVVAKLLSWKDVRRSPEAEIIEILGYPDDPGVDVLSIAKSHDIQTDFSGKIMQELETIKTEIEQAEIERRVDLRNETIFTIDPDDAKDFDDAISLTRMENGNYKLGVHIADVSHYVKPNMLLDKEALDRGTSIYLVDRVIPMLPEKLSNVVCSLRPNEDRLCFSVIMEITPEAKVVDYEIAETVIHSKRRFTYKEVQDLIDKPDSRHPFSNIIKEMLGLNKALLARRASRGGLDFGSNEVKFEMDDQGKPISIVKYEQLDSNRIIEEFMILANRIVAAHVSNMNTTPNENSFPYAYRVHEKPNPEKVEEFRRFLTAMEVEFTFKKKVSPQIFQNLVKQVKGTEKEIIIEDVMTRTMMKAKYDTKNVGHFGLALKYYSHFTSPIRRYPDLICHRILKGYISKPAKKLVTNEELNKICEQSSAREVVAQEAERESIKLKQVEYMADHVGDIFKGIISGVLSYGIFVEIIDTLAEGLVHISSLPGDYYVFDRDRYRIYGERHGKILQLGNIVYVRVIRVDVHGKLIDLELVDEDDYESSNPAA